MNTILAILGGIVMTCLVVIKLLLERNTTLGEKNAEQEAINEKTSEMLDLVVSERPSASDSLHKGTF